MEPWTWRRRPVTVAGILLSFPLFDREALLVPDEFWLTAGCRPVNPHGFTCQPGFLFAFQSSADTSSVPLLRSSAVTLWTFFFTSRLLIGLRRQPQSAAAALIRQSRIQASLLSGLELPLMHEKFIKFQGKQCKYATVSSKQMQNIAIFTVLLALACLYYSLQTDS